MSESPVLVERRDHITVVTLNRPGRLNAIDREAGAELARVFLDFENDKAQWVAVLTGTGRAFCTGSDLRAMAAGEGPSWDRPGSHGFGFAAITKRFPLTKPLIGAVNGVAFAGGLEMVLVCDIVVAASSARFGLTEVRWGLMPTGGGTQRLPRRVPAIWANYLALTGEDIDATTAREIGLVNFVVDDQSVLPRALEIAGVICTRGPLGVWAAKESMQRGQDMPLEQGLAFEDMLGRHVLASSDAKEGALAFSQKRPPRYKAE